MVDTIPVPNTKLTIMHDTPKTEVDVHKFEMKAEELAARDKRDSDVANNRHERRKALRNERKMRVMQMRDTSKARAIVQTSLAPFIAHPISAETRQLVGNVLNGLQGKLSYVPTVDEVLGLE